MIVLKEGSYLVGRALELVNRLNPTSRLAGLSQIRKYLHCLYNRMLVMDIRKCMNLQEGRCQWLCFDINNIITISVTIIVIIIIVNIIIHYRGDANDCASARQP